MANRKINSAAMFCAIQTLANWSVLSSDRTFAKCVELQAKLYTQFSIKIWMNLASFCFWSRFIRQYESMHSTFWSFFSSYFHGQNEYKIWVSVHCRVRTLKLGKGCGGIKMCFFFWSKYIESIVDAWAAPALVYSLINLYSIWRYITLAIGDKAHTRNYCPKVKEDKKNRLAIPVMLKKTMRQSDGQFR